MIAVDVGNACAVKGELIAVRLQHEHVFSYRMIELEVADAGVENPTPRLSFAAQPVRFDECCVYVEIDSSLLALGAFEVSQVRLLEPIQGDVNEVAGFKSGRDFERAVFEVVEPVSRRRSAEAVLQSVVEAEHELEERFFSPIDIRQSTTCDAGQYCVFVFVRDLLVSVSVRLNGMGLIPTNSGLESLDSFNFVNEFFRKSNFNSTQFIYDQTYSNVSRSTNPVCVAYFPSLIASSVEEAREYCVKRTNELILVYALLRDAGGTPFDVVVFDKNNQRAEKFAVISPYVGNLLTGSLAGEAAHAVEVYLAALLRDPFNEFLVSLYREARRERSPDFQYLRYWQILEAMADSKNYNPADYLVDYEGNVIPDAQQKPRRCEGSVNLVFRLIREAGIGGSHETWKNVNVWFAFRSAVAHHGSIFRYALLSRRVVRDWAEVGLREVSENEGRDVLLDGLREHSRLLLMRRLGGS